MAAGEGRRMRPISERWPKPVLPIDGRPVIGTLLRDLAAAGIERTTIVTGHLAERVERVLDDDPGNPIGGAPLWLAGPAVARFLDPLPGKPPYEVATVFQLAIDEGAEIRGIEIGPTRDL